jgi:GntR family transcriptional repressor for pyruvate dehydrogenase complex
MSQLLEEIQIHGVSDAISEQILRLISSGALRPGDALPPQRQLASRLGVSLSSLREALRGLAAIGVIEIKRGCGTYVCDHAAAALVKQFDWPLLLQEEEARELFEARRVIEVSVAGYAALRATTEQVESLKAFGKAMMVSWKARDLESLEQQDLQFHLAIAEAAGNSLLLHLAQSLYAVVERFIRIVPHTQLGLQNHLRVLEAIAQREPEEAQEAVRDLLDQTEQLYHKHKSSG